MSDHLESVPDDQQSGELNLAPRGPTITFTLNWGCDTKQEDEYVEMTEYVEMKIKQEALPSFEVGTQAVVVCRDNMVSYHDLWFKNCRRICLGTTQMKVSNVNPYIFLIHQNEKSGKDELLLGKPPDQLHFNLYYRVGLDDKIQRWNGIGFPNPETDIDDDGNKNLYIHLPAGCSDVMFGELGPQYSLTPNFCTLDKCLQDRTSSREIVDAFLHQKGIGIPIENEGFFTDFQWPDMICCRIDELWQTFQEGFDALPFEYERDDLSVLPVLPINEAVTRETVVDVHAEWIRIILGKDEVKRLSEFHIGVRQSGSDFVTVRCDKVLFEKITDGEGNTVYDLFMVLEGKPQKLKVIKQKEINQGLFQGLLAHQMTGRDVLVIIHSGSQVCLMVVGDTSSSVRTPVMNMKTKKDVQKISQIWIALALYRMENGKIFDDDHKMPAESPPNDVESSPAQHVSKKRVVPTGS